MWRRKHQKSDLAILHYKTELCGCSAFPTPKKATCKTGPGPCSLPSPILSVSSTPAEHKNKQKHQLFQNSNIFYWQKDRRNKTEDGIRIREKKIKKIKRTVFLSCLWTILVCNRSIQDIRRYLTAPFPLVRYLISSIFSLPYCLCDLVLLNLINILVCSSQI